MNGILLSGSFITVTGVNRASANMWCLTLLLTLLLRHAHFPEMGHAGSKFPDAFNAKSGQKQVLMKVNSPEHWPNSRDLIWVREQVVILFFCLQWMFNSIPCLYRGRFTIEPRGRGYLFLYLAETEGLHLSVGAQRRHQLLWEGTGNTWGFWSKKKSGSTSPQCHTSTC